MIRKNILQLGLTDVPSNRFITFSEPHSGHTYGLGGEIDAKKFAIFLNITELLLGN